MDNQGSYRLTLAKLKDGRRAVVSDDFLDWCAGRDDAGNIIRSCINRNQVGTLDRYVAWITDDAAPTDLEPIPGNRCGQVRGSL